MLRLGPVLAKELKTDDDLTFLLVRPAAERPKSTAA